MVNPLDRDINLKLAEWQHNYNWDHPHSSLGGKTPMDRFFELIKKTPYWDVYRDYHPEKKRIQDPNYQIDLRLKRIEELKRSM
jgi:hypothetical protein